MAQDIKDFDISKTFNNVVLTTVTGQPDADGVSNAILPFPYNQASSERDKGRLQDGKGNVIPLILSKNLIEVEAEPSSAYSVVRRVDIMATQASQFINTLIWS